MRTLLAKTLADELLSPKHADNVDEPTISQVDRCMKLKFLGKFLQ